MLSKEIRESVEKSVLCWLATSSADNIPNVSPKEAFMIYENESIIIANIASPQSVKNIEENAQVCLSVLDVFTQKGYQLKGVADIIDVEHPKYDLMKAALEQMTQGKFPFRTITSVSVQQSKKIIAPSYYLYPETTEQDQIDDALKSYQVRSLL